MTDQVNVPSNVALIVNGTSSVCVNLVSESRVANRLTLFSVAMPTVTLQSTLYLEPSP